MKIIHFADLHLGVETYGKLDPASGLSSRFVDFLNTFDQMVDYAVKERVDLVLFCGDAYKSRDPSQTQQREFAKRIKRLSQHGIPVFLLVGNHDLPNATGRATTTEIFDTLAVDGTYVAGKPGITLINTPSGPVQIVALPWLKRGNVIAREEVKNLDLNEVNQKMQEILTGILDSLIAKLDPAIPAVMAAHIWVRGAKVGSEDGMTIGQEHTLLLSTVANPTFDYVALGHIHRQQVMNEEPPVVYAGSLERLDFGDEKLDKGFYVVEIITKNGKRRTTYNMEPVDGRRFMTLNIAVKPDDPSPTDTIIKMLNNKAKDIKGSIVRLEISISQAQQAEINDADIRQAAAEASYFAISKKIERPARARLAEASVEGITPQQALETYLNMRFKDAPAARRKELLASGRDIIEAESIKAGR
jgi:exonuclease SbcD